MLTSDLDYDLPAEAIAQVPVEPRDAARLLVAGPPGTRPRHHRVAELADLLDPGDVLVLNDTRVIPARLRAHKATGGAVEVLLLSQRADGDWEALVRPSRRVPPGSHLALAPTADGTTSGPASVEVGDVLGVDGRRRVRLHHGEDIDDLGVLGDLGEVPLPPYIHSALADPERYQTVYAARPGSVAAPTAGLHLTPEVLDACRQRGVEVVRIDLEVGLGTFRPVTAERVEDHPMHAERYRITPEAASRLADRSSGTPGRVVAVGTTVVRALESWKDTGRLEGETALFIRRGFPFQVVERLLTNFHVPRSSLLALVDAFVGPRWKALYAEALADGYRMLSFGDAMLLDRDDRLSGAAEGEVEA